MQLYESKSEFSDGSCMCAPWCTHSAVPHLGCDTQIQQIEEQICLFIGCTLFMLQCSLLFPCLLIMTIKGIESLWYLFLISSFTPSLILLRVIQSDLPSALRTNKHAPPNGVLFQMETCNVINTIRHP